MKKVAPKARSFDSESPLTAAAIACSRMPKCRFLPPGVPGSKSPAPSNVRVVLLGEPRSADPPSSHGMFCASTLSTLPDASRPAIPLGSAGKNGSTRSHPLRRSPRSNGRGPARRVCRFSGEVGAHGVGNQEFGVLGPSVVAFGQADLFLAQRLAVRRGGILLMRRAGAA